MAPRPVRTSPAAKTEYAFYRAHAPVPVPLRALVAVAGIRWKVEEGLAGGKELTALDQHQVRSRASWMRWTILAMLAHAFLSVMTATQPRPGAGDACRDEAGHELIPLTRNEIRRLYAGQVKTDITAAAISNFLVILFAYRVRPAQSHLRAPGI